MIRDLPADVDLRDLSVSSGTLSPIFAMGRTNYTVNVGNDVTSLTVSATAYDSKAAVRVNNGSAASGSASSSISLSEGSNAITIEVIAQNGRKQVYTVNVIRARSSNNYLSNLAVSAGTLSPKFSQTVPGYGVSVGNEVASLTVTPTLADRDATVKVNGTTVTSGTASALIPLNVGANATTINIAVTAANGGTRGYTIVVSRAKSGEATLSNLTISAGTLNPGFSAGTLSYNVHVGDEVDQLTVLAEATSDRATVELRTGVSPDKPNGGLLENPIGLNVGLNVIRVVVTAENGNSRIYVLQVTRAKSPNADLRGLVISQGELGAFSPNTTSYSAVVARDITQLTVTPTLAHEKATWELTDGSGSPLANPINLQLGSNMIKVVVTAEDKAVTKTYTITVSRAWLPYTVTFVMNDGSEDQTSQIVYEGTTIGATLPTPTSAHYTFGGWNTEPNGSGDMFGGNTAVYHDYTVYALWTPKDYLLTFRANGVMHDSKAFSYGAKVGAWRPMAQPTREHYVFNGWNTQNDGTGDDLEDTTEVRGEMIFYAQWAPAPYTVSFDQNLAEATPPDPIGKVFGYGAKVGSWRPATPTSEHHNFMGWNRAANGSGAALTSETEVLGDMTFFAQWTPKNYTVTFIQNGGETPGYPLNRTVAYAGTVAAASMPAAPTRNHYTFFRWEDADGNEFKVDITQVTGNITVYAKWTARNYTVTFNATGGMEFDPPSISVPFGATGELPAAIREHYDFVGWYPNENLTGAEVVTYAQVAADITVYAKWTPQTYTVTFDGNGGKGQSGEDYLVTRTAPYGGWVSSMPSPAPILDHYTFSGWSTASDGNGTAFTSGTSVYCDTIVYAKWTPKTYTISFGLNYAGAGANPDNMSVTHPGSLGALHEPLRDHYTFVGWNSRPGGDGVDYAAGDSLTSNVTVYAQWTPKTYTLTFKLNYEGAVDNLESMSVVYPANLGELPDPAPPAHYMFARWNTKPEGDGVDYDDGAALAGDNTVYAQWIHLYDITLGSFTDGNSIEAPASAQAGAVVTLTLRPASGWRLKVGTLQSLEGTEPVEINHVFGGTYTFVMPAADITVTALFEQYFTVTFDKGGYGTNETREVIAGQAVGEGDMPPAPRRDDFAFTGWNTAQNSGGNDFYATTPVTGDIRVYAQWGPLYRVNFGAISGDGTFGVDPAQGVAGTIITVTIDPEDGYRLQAGTLRYAYGADNVEITQTEGVYRFQMPASNVAVSAVFEQYFTVTFMDDGVEYAKRNAASGQGVDSMPAAPILGGHKFMGWKTAGGADFIASTPVTGDATVSAQWSALHSITIGSVTGDGAVTCALVEAMAGEPVSLEITPGEGMRLKEGSLQYSYGAITETIAGPPYTFVMPAGNVTVTAMFEEVPTDAHSITWDVQPPGSATVSASATTAVKNTVINLTITPKSLPGDKWRLAEGTLRYRVGTVETYIEGLSFVMPDADVLVTAEFERLSSSADLSSLLVNGVVLSPSGPTAYSARVTQAAVAINVAATLADSNATIEIGGVAATSGVSTEVALAPGDSAITVLVTAEDGTTKAFTLTVARLSSDASLRDATVYANGQRQEFSNEVDEHGQPTFHPDWPAHSIGYYLAAGQTSVGFTVDVTPSEGHATVSAVIPGIDGLPDVPVSYIDGSFTLNGLEAGGYDVQFTITAEDGATWTFSIWFGVYAK